MNATKIKLITDTASDLPDELLSKHDIHMVPLTIHFGEKEYKDRVELPIPAFYKELAANTSLPSTSQVNPDQFIEVYKRYLAEGYKILVVGISLKLSGTLQSAQIAKDMLESDEITIFDSKSASLGEGLCVLKAAQCIAEGMTIPQIVQVLETQRAEATGLFVLDSLQHLVRGGRLSKTQAVVGSVLNIKPLLSFANSGEIVVKEKVRSQKRALQIIINRFKEQNLDFSTKTMGIINTECLELANEFAKVVQEEFSPKDIIIATGGATIGTHVGTGGIGLFC